MTTQAQTQPKSVTVDAEGDSTMWGYRKQPDGTVIQVPQNPPVLLQQSLRAAVGPSVTVQNNAISGTSLGNRMDGTGGFVQPYATFAAANHADIVIENFALNDTNQYSVEQFQSYLTAFVQQSQQLGRIVVLEEPNPTNVEAFNQLVAQRVAVIDAVAQMYNVPVVKQWDYIQSLPNWQSLLSPDGIHPSDALYAIKAQREESVIAPLVKSLTGG
jgi:lysophospholipase L1-like esterase